MAIGLVTGLIGWTIGVGKTQGPVKLKPAPFVMLQKRTAEENHVALFEFWAFPQL